MNSVTADGFPAPPPSPDRPLPPVNRPHAVSEVPPAKKITFYKSGDPQFGGVKLAINRRSFKSFSALMDDLSNRVPLPFGVRTVTTPRGTHCINRLDQLQDGGSYICSDKKYVQPITGRRVGAHRVSRPVSARKQGQQEEAEEAYSATHFQQVPKLRKKIVMVKNGDPTVRRSILLNRRNARNFKTFLEDASDLLHFTVRRIYTMDGKRVENIQAILHSPSILICAGREPFKPIQSENMHKSTTEKLPGLRSQHNGNSEVMDNKKNANFGLKAKKSVIHPRSASSNKTRFSPSSEKSYPNGLNMSPANSGFASSPHGKSEDTGHSLVNDDIEKKVHVNKDGSLSVEMKVRFRLLNEETLQWSTQIKKSGKGKCEQLYLCDENDQKENPEIYSETDESFYPCDADSYSSKLNDAELEDMYCEHCGMQCQDYDIWKNPMHANTNPQEHYVKRATWQTQSTASSTSSHHKLACKEKTSIDSLHSMSSEEYTEHVLHKSTSYSETRENGETTIRYSTVSQCTSRSGQSSAASNAEVYLDKTRKNTGDSNHRSCSSHSSQMSFQSQHSQHSEGQKNLKSQGGSFEDCKETSPTPCSGGECCIQKVSAVSKSSLHSRTSRKSLLKRNSTHSKSFGSYISYNEDEEEDETSAKATLKNMLGISIESETSEHHSGSECTQQPEATNELAITDGHENGGNATPGVTLRYNNSECDKCSTKSSCQSRSSAKRKGRNKSCGQNNDQVLCHSPALSDVSKQNSEEMVNHQENRQTCEATTADVRSSCSKMSRKSYGQSCGQSMQSNQSHRSTPPLGESALAHEQEDQQVINQESGEEIPESYHGRESENCTTATAGEDDLASLPISRTSSKSQSFSSKCNNISCPENEKNYSLSSRVSSASEKKSKPGSPEISDQMSSNGSAREMSQNSQEDEKPTDQQKASETCSKRSGCDANSIHSPSPPKEKPVKRHSRSSQYKYSRASMSSDPMKNINGEKMGSSRSSTPKSKGMMASKTSIETCKMLKNAASCNSTEDILNTKKRKNSSSSTKRKLKRGSLDSENNSELIPSALPNVTPEEVVNEWLKKIPSETMVVEYEAEECLKKVSMENDSKTSKMDSDKSDSGEVNEVVTKVQNSNQTEKVTDVGDDNSVNQTEFTNLCDKLENDEHFLANNLKTNSENNNAVTVESTCNKKIFPNNVHTSVQIMKALLNPSQESKFDRSNSLPEVSQTMGRKLSNSAKVLISCLASLHLLDDGPTDRTKISNDLNTPKYIELLNIFQALWSEGPNSKSITSIKSAKHYSREDELTPVSSSGVDINSGYGGSGDGSITGGGDNVTTERPEDNKLTVVAEEVECTAKSIQQCVKEPSISGDRDADNSQPPTSEAVDAGFDETKPCVMDENMNEKKIGNSFDRDVEDTAIKHENSDPMNIISNEHTETVVEQSVSMSDTMNIHSHSGNETKSNESNSQETNCINSPSECPSTIISTSESNGKNDPISNNLGCDADPVWVLKLLKKIEKEFMTHYVNAMNEFKVRWNLENNENLDEMILELKNEVSQRIQRSISNELKKIKSQAGTKVPRPPDDGPRRKSSLLAEERRRRLQALHRRSIHNYISSENKEGGTNDSCETDEEDLTFSASFADDSSGQANDDFCPCDKCIRQKRALKLARPKPPVADAPIMKAFDLQQILKIKREKNEANDDGAIVTSAQECDKDEESATGKHCFNGGNDEEPTEAGLVESEPNKLKIIESDILGQENQDNEHDIQEDISVAGESKVCETKDLQCEATQEGDVENKESEVENKSPGDFTDEMENVDTGESDKISTGVEEKQMSIDCPQDACSTAVSEEEHQNKEEDCLEDLGEETGKEATFEHDAETAEVSESEDEQHLADNRDATDKCPKNGDCHYENKTDNPVINTEEDSESEESETVESHSSCIQKSCLGQASLITQNGSAEEPEEECKEVNHSLGETSPNGHSNGSDSKKSQMYPESSEEEDGDSPRASPVGITKSVSTGKVCVNNKDSFEDHTSKKGLEDDALDQDDFDF